jgi:hypothetical protein
VCISYSAWSKNVHRYVRIALGDRSRDLRASNSFQLSLREFDPVRLAVFLKSGPFPGDFHRSDCIVLHPRKSQVEQRFDYIVVARHEWDRSSQHHGFGYHWGCSKSYAKNAAILSDPKVTLVCHIDRN